MLVIVAGALMAANFAAHQVKEMNGESYGFPLPMYQNWKPEVGPWRRSILDARFTHDSYMRIGPIEFKYGNNGWSYSLLAINFVAWLLMFAVAAFCVEKFVRSQEKH